MQSYSLLPNYADVFSKTNEFNNESIFEIDFVTAKLNSYQHAFFFPNKIVNVKPFSDKTWYVGYLPLQKFVYSFEPNDKRKDVEIALGHQGNTFTPDVANKVSIWFGLKWWRLSANERDSELDIYVFRYADVLLMQAEAANELNQTAVALAAVN